MKKELVAIVSIIFFFSLFKEKKIKILKKKKFTNKISLLNRSVIYVISDKSRFFTFITKDKDLL